MRAGAFAPHKCAFARWFAAPQQMTMFSFPTVWPLRSGANCALSHLRDVGRLRAFLALNDFELDSIAFGKRLETGA